MRYDRRMRCLGLAVVLASLVACASASPGRKPFAKPADGTRWQPDEATEARFGELVRAADAHWQRRHTKTEVEAAIDSWLQIVDLGFKAADIFTHLSGAYYVLAEHHMYKEDPARVTTYGRGLDFAERALTQAHPEFHGGPFEPSAEFLPTGAVDALGWYAMNADRFAQLSGPAQRDYYEPRLQAAAGAIQGLGGSLLSVSEQIAGADPKKAPPAGAAPVVKTAARPPASLVTPPAPAAGYGSVDIQDWLGRPGVKLLAIEFYATWCKPCIAAVPRWKALHDKYRKQGLRLVVVATEDSRACTVNPGWNPDDVVCDDEGTVARALKTQGKLPSAYLWSWQGNLLVRRGHVDSVETEIQRWMQSAPRVNVEIDEVAPAAGIEPKALRDLVRARLKDDDKLVIVATAEERARLATLKAESLKARYDDSLQCEVGKELSANSLLQVRIFGAGARKRLQLNLLSAERGCLVASSLVDWNAAKPGVSVAEAAAELMHKLQSRVAMPRS